MKFWHKYLINESGAAKSQLRQRLLLIVFDPSTELRFEGCVITSFESFVI